jgi:hypothetical protein
VGGGALCCVDWTTESRTCCADAVFCVTAGDGVLNLGDLYDAVGDLDLGGRIVDDNDGRC